MSGRGGGGGRPRPSNRVERRGWGTQRGNSHSLQHQPRGQSTAPPALAHAPQCPRRTPRLQRRSLGWQSPPPQGIVPGPAGAGTGMMDSWHRSTFLGAAWASAARVVGQKEQAAQRGFARLGKAQRGRAKRVCVRGHQSATGTQGPYFNFVPPFLLSFFVSPSLRKSHTAGLTWVGKYRRSLTCSFRNSL
jgi:hypothetical protein